MTRRLAVFMFLMVAHAQQYIVRVEQGLLRGRNQTSVLGQTFYSFKGIPYARPPLGALRFKDAQQPESWKGVRDATKPGSPCTQYDENESKYVGCEDCLYLNVYTPQLPKPGSAPLPVMFWIHGGGFHSGSGMDDMFGPDFLISQDVVLVLINYRLSCFGFLFLNVAVPGNVGLKDQVAALRWVNKNIAVFNGDPDKITIFGDSAGGASVHWHTLSPMSKGLYHGAIAESGAAINPWARQWKPYETSVRLARAVGCTDDDDDNIVECLRNVNHTELAMAARTDAPTQRDRDRLVIFPFTPTGEEKRVHGVETFATGPPEQLIQQGCQHDVPYMTGVNNQESAIAFASNTSIFKDNDELRTLDSNWTKYVFPETRLADNTTNVSEAMNKLREFFLNGEPLSSKNVAGYTTMLTDLLLEENMFYVIRNMPKSRKSDVYMYYFTVDQDLNILKHEFNLTLPGAAHGDEVGYLFNGNLQPNVSPNNPAFFTRMKMVRLWTNFAKFGKPTPTDDPLICVEWKAYTCSEPNFLEIGSQLKPGKNLHEERVKFWEEFYEEFGSQQTNDGRRCWTCHTFLILKIIFSLVLISCL